ncbi:ABC transporter ATP-binding protein [Oscillospiraceae bacterium MB08-C2-2]|nr:ABC transporter ATP-binding protein [Oscillospiraceae bacterium MB08-C2-2]
MSDILVLDRVCKRFGGVVAADDVSFAVPKGQVIGLIGPNGAGKSTMLNMISGIYEVDGGSITFNDQDVTKLPPYTRACMGIGRTFQTPRFLQRSNIRDNLLMGTDLADQKGYLKSFFGKRNHHFEDELAIYLKLAGFSVDLESDITSLSYGKLKLLEIVRSLLGHPKVMLVDEPAAGLNTKEIEYAMALLNYAAQEKNIGVVLIEHQMDMVMNICKYIVVLSFGQLIARGTPGEISTNQQVITAYLGGV